ncbi:MAG: hypothetical protein HC878_14465 [Leptolyngbyaceae cyanobacterium SL_5_14]|nr:hypothetical protein [Leptolyngbyaceae cyanobacterium SL_5_14]
MKLIRQVWEDIRRGENIDLYVAVPLAIVIAVLGILGITSSQLISSITLVILGLLATSLLTSRYAVKELSQKLTQTADTTFFKEWTESNFESDFESAADLWLVGVSLTTMIRMRYSLIERKLRAGHTVKALLINPDGLAVEMAEMRNYGRPNAERARSEIRNSLQDLCDLSQVAPGKLEIRTIQHPLGHGVMAKDPETASGAIYIQNYPFKTENGSRPKFVLRAKDGFWYDFFKRELYNLWENGSQWSCEAKGQ